MGFVEYVNTKKELYEEGTDDELVSEQVNSQERKWLMVSKKNSDKEFNVATIKLNNPDDYKIQFEFSNKIAF